MDILVVHSRASNHHGVTGIDAQAVEWYVVLAVDNANLTGALVHASIPTPVHL